MPETPYYAAADTWCEDCAPDAAEPGFFEEADSPQHCSGCGEPLDVSLTSEGVCYVFEAMHETLKQPELARNRIMPLKGTAEESMIYWHGSRHVEIVRSWAEMIEGYGLEDEEARQVADFLKRTAPPQ